MSYFFNPYMMGYNANRFKGVHNTLEHEKQHMIGHIIDHYGIKPSSEEAGYLAGYVGALFTKPIKDEICDCCKKKLK